MSSTPYRAAGAGSQLHSSMVSLLETSKMRTELHAGDPGDSTLWSAPNAPRPDRSPISPANRASKSGSKLFWHEAVAGDGVGRR